MLFEFLFILHKWINKNTEQKYKYQYNRLKFLIDNT